MKKSILFLALAPALIAQGPRGGGFGPMGGRGGGMFGGPQAYVTGAPYSGVEVMQRQEVLADGNTITTKHQTNVFRDGQGRVRTEETITPPASSGQQPYTLVTILDFVGGNRYLLDSSTMKALQSPLRTPRQNSGNAPSTGRRGPGGADAPQITRTTLPPQSVNGIPATGTQLVETIPAGKIGNERPIQVSRTVWISTDLKVPVEIKSSDPRFGTTAMDLTNVVQAEPSPSLFMVPAGYAVQSGGGGRGFGGPGGPGGARPQMQGGRPGPQ